MQFVICNLLYAMYFIVQENCLMFDAIIYKIILNLKNFEDHYYLYSSIFWNSA